MHGKRYGTAELLAAAGCTDPASQDNNCAQGRIINDLSDSTKHALAALLDRASELKAMAEHATEEEKAKAQKVRLFAIEL